jgi:hypothetical protein
MIRRTLLPSLAAFLLLGILPAALARTSHASPAPRAPLDPWQREFFQNAFGTLEGAVLEASGPRSNGGGVPPGAPVWSEYGPPVARAAAAGAYDMANHQVVLFGGSDGANRSDVWTLRLSDTTFVKFRALGVPPSARVGHSMVYDTLRKRVLVFGGWDGEYKNDLWQLSLVDSTWTSLGATGPPGRAAHSAVYDPLGDRMIVYGGWDGTTHSDVWSLALSGNAWTELHPSGDAPIARYGHSAVWDDSLSRMLVFAGEWRNGDDFQYLNDVQRLSLAGAPSWSPLSTRTSPPPARYSHTAILDPRNDKMIVFGGWTGVYRKDTWELSLLDSTWKSDSQVTNLPAARANHVAVYDTLGRRMLIVWGWGDGQPRNNQHGMLALTGDWTLLSATRRAPQARFASTLVYDAPRDRVVLFGGSNVGAHLSDVWWFPLGGSTWVQQSTGGTTPPGRSDHAAVFDSVNNQMIVMGGRSHTYGQVDQIRFDDLWTLPLVGLPNWTPVVPQTAPRSRTGESIVLDPAHRRAILFGGLAGASYKNDTWVLDLVDSSWTRIVPLDAPPPVRAEHAAIYDAARDRMIIYGGQDASGLLDDVWELSLAGTARWTRLQPSGASPGVRYGHSMTLDAPRSRAIVFGGFKTLLGPVNETWELSLAGAPAWNQLLPSGTPPPARGYHSAVANDQSLVVFGGLAEVNGPGGPANDLWTLTLATPAWQQIQAHGAPDTDVLRPNARIRHVAVYDPAADRMLLFGGTDVDTVVASDHESLVRGAVWSLRLANFAWAVLDSSEEGPEASADQHGVYDVDARRMLLVGESGGSRIDVLTYSFSLTVPFEWSQIDFPGRSISPRFGHAMVFDPVGRRVVVFGGNADGHPNETWTLELADPSWSILEVVGTPPPGRDNHSGIYDQSRNRMVLFGGFDGTAAMNDLWSLTLDAVPTWSAITATGGGPTARYNHTAVYDRGRDRMIVLGGWDGALRDDAWELSLSNNAWTQVQPTGAGTVAREEHVAAYDIARDRMLVFGGYATSRISAPRNDLWALTWPAAGPGPNAAVLGLDAEPGGLSVTWQVNESAPFTARVYRAVDGSGWSAIATLRDAGNGRVTFTDRDLPAGTRFGYRLGLLREGGEDLTGEVWTDAPAERPGTLPVVFPIPARGGFSVSFTLPDPRPARLDLFDLAGRRVFGRNIESLGVGTHRLAIGDNLPAGVYLVQLTHGGVSRTTRAVVLQ